MEKEELRTPVETILTYCHEHCWPDTQCNSTCILKKFNGRCPIYADDEQRKLFDLKINNSIVISDNQVLNAVYKIISQCGSNNFNHCKRPSCPLYCLSPHDCAYDFTEKMKKAVYIWWTKNKKPKTEMKNVLLKILRNTKVDK